MADTPVSTPVANTPGAGLDGFSKPNPDKRYCGNRLTKKGCHWLCAGITAAVVLAVLLIVIFVGGSAIAQQAADNAGVSVEEMYVTNIPTDPSNNTMTVVMAGTLDNRAPLQASMSATTMTASSNGQDFGTFEFPAMTLQTGQLTPYNFTTTMTITNQAAFTAWATQMLNMASVSITMSGKPTIKAMGLSFSVTMSKQLTLTGVNGFSNPPVQVTSAQVQYGEENSLGFAMTAVMSNPSIMTIANLGRLNLTVMYKNTVIGTASTVATNNPLMSGPNEMQFVSVLTKTSENAEIFPQFLGTVASGQFMTLTMVGNSNSTDYPLFAGAMQNMQNVVSMNALAVVSVPTINSNDLVPNASSNGTVIAESNLYYYALNHNVTNLQNYMFQAVFQVMSATTLLTQTSSQCMDGAGGPYMDVVTLLWNSLATPVTINGINLTIYFPGDDDLKVAPFEMAVTHPEMLAQNRNGVPVADMEPFTKTLSATRLCVTAPIPTLLNWINNWVCKKYPGTAPWSFPTELVVTGVVSATLGSFTDVLPFSQYAYIISQMQAPGCELSGLSR